VITKLKLLHFGRFENRTFPFKAFTFFHGDNEAGKTTVFDALFQELCSPRAGRVPGRLLKERYGEARKARLIFDGAPLSLDEDEFLNLCAVRSGEISLELDSPAAALDRLRAELYSGGLDPGLLARRFTGLASRKKTFRHNQELAALEKRRKELENRWKTLNEKRRAVLEQEAAAGEAGSRLDSLAAKTAAVEKRCRRLETELDRERKIAERRALDDLLDLLDRAQHLQEELAAAPAEGRDETAALDRLIEEQGKQKQRLRESRSRAEQLRRSLNSSRDELARLSASQPESAGLAARAGELLALIEARSSAGSAGAGLRSSWNRGLLLAALLVFLAGLAVGFAVSSRIYQLIVSLSGFFGALIVLFSARRRTAPAPEKELIPLLKDEFRNLSGGRTLASSTLTGISQELMELRLEADWLTRELAGRTEAHGQLASSLAAEEAEIRAAAEAAEKSRIAVTDWLASRSVADRDAYLALRHRQNSAAAELLACERRLEQEMAARQADSTNQLRRDCARRLSELDQEGVPGKGKTKQEVRRLETALQEEERRLAELRNRQNDLRTRQAGVQGRISGSLGDLPEQMVRCEKELQQVEAEIETREEEREAAALLATLFGDLAGAAEANFAGLEEELSSWFSELAPESRKVALTHLDTRSLRAGDAGGAGRLLTHLSRGTRDAFLLASRLALARKAATGILVLDEPFLALDLRRSERALRLLGRFQVEQGWQIVLFSKDKRLFTLAKTLFPDGQFTSL
jgi:DNA repair exonuclease SbcCD ATPase subunit